MKYEEAARKVRDLSNKMMEHSQTAENASRTYAATMELFNVASSTGDEESMQKHRDTLHTTVDIILDSGAMIQQLTKEQREIAKSVTDFPRHI